MSTPHIVADQSAAAGDTIMSIWTKLSEECFQNHVDSMTQRIKAVLKVKGVQPGTSKVDLIKWPGSVYSHVKYRV